MDKNQDPKKTSRIRNTDKQPSVFSHVLNFEGCLLSCLAENIPSISACSRIRHWLPGLAAVTCKYKKNLVFTSLNTLKDRGKETVNMSPTT